LILFHLKISLTNFPIDQVGREVFAFETALISFRNILEIQNINQSIISVNRVIVSID
jgi:hypothetical protein